MKRFAYLAIAMMLFVGCATQKKAVVETVDTPIEVEEKVLQGRGTGRGTTWDIANKKAKTNALGDLAEAFKTKVQTMSTSHSTSTGDRDKYDFETLTETFSKVDMNGIDFTYDRKSDKYYDKKKDYYVVVTATFNARFVKRTIDGLVEECPAENRAAFRNEMYEAFGIQE